ncbi:Putative F-box/LRR-repeat protein At4g13960 [Linum grandiflorum]
MDRLSNLPQPLIHHILSFLNTRSAVQTSVLSRQWRCTWKHLPVLIMRHSSSRLSRSPRSFKRYVEKVLLLRYQLNLTKVIFSEYLEYRDTKRKDTLFARVSSLTTLQLTSFSFSNRFQWSGFVVLGKLDLSKCTFFARHEDVIIDPFANLPCLKDLVLDVLFCNLTNGGRRFRISGLQLLRLRLSYSHFDKMEIYAPNLKYFTLEYINEHRLVKFTNLTLPSLDHADIRISDLKEDVNEYTKQQLIPLFHGLNNATSLALCPCTVRMLRDISDYLEHQPSPFTRLKSLIMCSLRDDVPSAMLNYFLKGSSDIKPVVKFRT